jgi:hypothetical protein
LQKNASPDSDALRDTDDMQDQKQRHGERGNVAHGKDGHDSAGDSVRINDTGEHALDQSIDKVGDSQDPPEDEAFAMRGAGQPESREQCCHADGDIPIRRFQDVGARRHSGTKLHELTKRSLKVPTTTRRCSPALITLPPLATTTGKASRSSSGLRAQLQLKHIHACRHLIFGPGSIESGHERAKQVPQLWQKWQVWLWPAIILAGSVFLALIVHSVLFAVAKRVTKRTGGPIGNSLVRHAEAPSRWISPLLAIILALPAVPVRDELVQIVRHVVGLGVIAAMARVIILLADVFGDAVYAHYRTDIADNLTARRIRTQITVLRRIFTLLVIVVTAAIILMTFPAIHQLGTSLLASAGIAGIIVGMAMKSTLSSLIAGLQIALTEPIRIDDVVIVAGEWG